jgi:energy-coupling factor transport system permease protein
VNGAMKKGIRLDPRVKLTVLFLCVLSTVIAPSLPYGLGLVALIAILGALCGRIRYALIAVLAYAVFYALTITALGSMTGSLRTTLIAFFGLVHKVYPCGMLSGIIISTTRVSEFLSAMSRVHAPKKFVIPLAVMLRYIPTIREDWNCIKDAMKMRDLSPSFKGFVADPGMTVDCIYVPFMMAASKAADELSIASMTRGIENPKNRTCLVQVKIRCADILFLCCFAFYFGFGFFI